MSILKGDAEHDRNVEAAHRSPPTLPLLWCLLSAALFGASTPAAKALLGNLRPLTLSGLLYLGGALAVLPLALRERLDLRTIDRRNGVFLLGSVTTGGVLGPILLLSGLSLTTAGSVSLWLTLESGDSIARLRSALERE